MLGHRLAHEFGRGVSTSAVAAGLFGRCSITYETRTSQFCNQITQPRVRGPSLSQRKAATQRSRHRQHRDAPHFRRLEIKGVSTLEREPQALPRQHDLVPHGIE